MTQKELSAEEAILQKKSEKGPFPIFSEAKRGWGGGGLYTLAILESVESLSLVLPLGM